MTFLAVMLATMLALATCSTESPELDPLAHTGPEPIVYTADLDSLNDSGVSGTATLTLEQIPGQGQSLTVELFVEGVEPDQLHPQHIHGFKNASRNAVCPTEDSQDQIAGLPEQAEFPDELISVEEGLDDYGPILLPLTPFPVPEDNSTYHFKQAYSNNELQVLQPIRTTLTNRHTVIHGAFVSSDDPTTEQVYIATLPVACGQIQLAD